MNAYGAMTQSAKKTVIVGGSNPFESIPQSTIASRKQHYKQSLIDQIIRDNWTLDNDPTPAPDARFYIDRIAAYTNEVHSLGECD